MKIRKGYNCESCKYYGCYDGGTQMVWKITTPSGQKYKINKPSGGRAYIETRYKSVGIADDYNDAMKQIYEWEDNGVSFEPDLSNKDEVIALMKGDHICLKTKLLIEDNIIVPNLQTAVFLFHDQYVNKEGTRQNLAKMLTILRTIRLNDDELFTFCRYAIKKDPMCAETIPGDLLTKAIKTGRAAVLCTPSTEGIDVTWYDEPCFVS